jgi:Hemerythrin HHE cation binding domain
MTEMSMNRAIHCAVRRDLDRFVKALANFPEGDVVRGSQLGRAWANFDDQLRHHHQGEHEIAWPALRAIGVSDEVIRQMDAEHDTMAAALAEARTAVEALSITAEADEAQAALNAVERLRTVTVEHLDHEEREIEDVYLSKKDTPEIKAMGRAFAKVSPARGGRFFEWVLDGASPEEQAAIKGNVPGPVLTIIGGIFGRGYRKNVAPVWRD